MGVVVARSMTFSRCDLEGLVLGNSGSVFGMTDIGDGVYEAGLQRSTALRSASSFQLCGSNTIPSAMASLSSSSSSGLRGTAPIEPLDRQGQGPCGSNQAESGQSGGQGAVATQPTATSVSGTFSSGSVGCGQPERIAQRKIVTELHPLSIITFNGNSWYGEAADDGSSNVKAGGFSELVRTTK
eukprot:1677099-Pyramimonas_sp.AAC.1